MHLVRTVCQRDAGFEPNFVKLGNSLESLLSMVAAGRGVLLTRLSLLDAGIGYFSQGIDRRGA